MEIKPAVKTSEFWLSLLVILIAAILAFVIKDISTFERVISLAISALLAASHGVNRSKLKSTALQMTPTKEE